MSTIRDRILARRDLDALREAKDLDGLAAALNTEVHAVLTESWVDAPGIINRCPSGKSILRKLKAGAGADAIIEMAWQSLVFGKGLDFGAASTLNSIDEMRPALGFTDTEVAELQALGQQPVYVTREQVNDAMYNPDGSEK
jgi:hypothetical protein